MKSAVQTHDVLQGGMTGAAEQREVRLLKIQAIFGAADSRGFGKLCKVSRVKCLIRIYYDDRTCKAPSGKGGDISALHSNSCINL